MSLRECAGSQEVKTSCRILEQNSEGLRSTRADGEPVPEVMTGSEISDGVRDVCETSLRD